MNRATGTGTGTGTATATATATATGRTGNMGTVRKLPAECAPPASSRRRADRMA